MYAPETYKPSSDADKVPDGAGGGGEDGIAEGGEKKGWGSERIVGEGFFCWMGEEQARGSSRFC